ncbi:MAG: DUF3267 domain-containing protein [Anaeroplasmataceae bacterium]
MENFYKELPDNYKEYKVIDAKKSSTMVWFTIVNIIVTVLAIVPFFFIFKFNFKEYLNYLSIVLFIFCLAMILYIILHELVHGLFYKLLTKEKLTFGITLTVAFCGVPNIYVSKKTALIAVLAPFVFFSIVFLSLIFLLPYEMVKLIFILLFGVHFGGCIGDLYVAFILFKSKGNILMNDTGPKQTFYKYEE